eukprot:1835003-Amphidinium_carterae.3
MSPVRVRKGKAKGSKKGKTVRSGSVSAVSADDHSEVIRMGFIQGRVIGAEEHPFGSKISHTWVNQCRAFHHEPRFGHTREEMQDGQCSQCQEGHRFNRQSESGWSVQSIPSRPFGSMRRQNQDGQCSQCQGNVFGSIRGQNHGGQYSHCHYHQNPRQRNAGEDQWISQCSPGSFDSWGAC